MSQSLTMSMTSGSKSEAPKSRKMLYGANMLKHVLKRGGREGAELKIDDLDETVLQARLDRLNEELSEYKTKCLRYKKENDWYRQEIETCQKDTAEYIAYLESKQKEKQNVIDSLNDANRRDHELFNEKKKERETQNEVKINELKVNIAELEEKLDIKQQQIMKLSDVMTRRARHEAEISRIRREMQVADAEHKAKVATIERSLIETRIRVQREADDKLQTMQSEAQMKAIKYLEEHTQALDAENSKLEHELNACNQTTQDQLERKAVLERENKELEREQKLRQDLIRLRIQRIQTAQIKKDREETARKTEMVQHRRLEIAKILQKTGNYPQLLKQTTGLTNQTPNSVVRNTISRPGQKIPNANGVISDGFDPLDLDWSDDDFQ